MSFHSYIVVFCAAIPIWCWEFPILDPVAWVIAFKLHGEGIRGSQALSIALQGWAPNESILYGPSRPVEHVWSKIPQFPSVGRVQKRHLLIINLWERRCPFRSGKDYYILRKYVGVLYMSFHSYRVVLCAPIPTDRELPILDPVAWVISFKLHVEGIRGAQALSIALQGWAPNDSFL